MKPIDKQLFLDFCSHLTIPAKEGDAEKTGKQLVPLVLLPTQKYVLDNLISGFDKNIHSYVILKCRQSGITTLGLALDLYWCFKFDGIVHNFIGDRSKVTSYNRSLLRDFVRSLQDYPEWHQKVDDDNSDLIKFRNRSQILWHTANTRESGSLGRSVGAMAVHGTEVGSWKDEEGTASLFSSIAKRNPNRFFLWEGTASSMGVFQDMCVEAQRDDNLSHHFCFVGFFLQPDYESDLRTPEGRKEYRVYWESNPVLSREEQSWVDYVKARYKYEIRPTQISWFRYHLKELKFGNLDLMYQEYPPTEQHAWRYGAKGFINSAKAVERETIIINRKHDERRYFKFDFGKGIEFNDCKPIEVDPENDFYDLTIWEEPHDPGIGVRYAIGVDPSHGADEASDDASVQVLRCYSDQCVQVAEFCANEIATFKLAWVILHLAGTYNASPLLNIELAGGGTEVHGEIDRLQKQQAFGYDDRLNFIFSNLELYQWSPPDAIKGRSASYHTKTSTAVKESFLNAIRDLFERGMLDINSRELLSELKGVHWIRDGSIEVPRPNHRLMALGMGIMAYKQILARDIGGSKYTRQHYEQTRRESFEEMVPLTQEQFLAVRLLDWRDKAIMASREKADNIANGVPWQKIRNDHGKYG